MEVYQSSKTAAEMEFALRAIPSIGANNHWFIGDQDTGVLAEGLTPYVGANDHWFVGDTDTGIVAKGLNPYVGANGNWWVGETDSGIFAGGVKIEGAVEVGQTIVVKAVDENGRPTEWEAASRACGELPVVAEVILAEEVSTITIDTDLNGNPISISEAYVCLSVKGGSTNESTCGVAAYWNKSNTATNRHSLPNFNVPAASTDTSVANNQYAAIYRYQKLKYGYTGPGYFSRDTYNNVRESQPYHFLTSQEWWDRFDTDKFTALTLYCGTDGYTFGIGSKIRLYGR